MPVMPPEIVDHTTITPPLFYWIYRNLTWIIPIITIVAGGAAVWFKVMVLKPLRAHNKRLKAIERVIPIEALEKEHMLQTVLDSKELLKPVVESQTQLRRIIPTDAIEKGHTLQTAHECKNERENCSVNCIVEELAADIKTLLTSQGQNTKRIVTALTTLANRLPLDKEDRETILKELIP
jgi:hypothetical protein